MVRTLMACLALSTSAAAGAQPVPATLAEIDVHPALPDVGTAPRIEVRGRWPDACVPELHSAEVMGRELVLRARTALRGCSGAARDFSLNTGDLPRAATRLVAGGVNRIRFEVAHGDAPGVLYGFRLLHVGNSTDTAYVPETGFWWPERGGEFDRAGPGLGVQMEAQGDTLSVGAFGYDGEGRSGWFFGAGTLERRTARVGLSRLQDGSGPFQPYRAPSGLQAIGDLHIELLSPSRATLWFLAPLPGGRGWSREGISMVRFRFAQEAGDAWLGRWVVLARDAGSFPTLRIDFSRLERQAAGYVLLDGDDSHRLECELNASLPNSPPRRCRLSAADGMHPDVDFDAVALNELRGFTPDGQRIVALRLQH